MTGSADLLESAAAERAAYFAYTDAVVAVHGERFTPRQARQRRFDALRDAWLAAYAAGAALRS